MSRLCGLVAFLVMQGCTPKEKEEREIEYVYSDHFFVNTDPFIRTIVFRDEEEAWPELLWLSQVAEAEEAWLYCDGMYIETGYASEENHDKVDPGEWKQHVAECNSPVDYHIHETPLYSGRLHRVNCDLYFSAIPSYSDLSRMVLLSLDTPEKDVPFRVISPLGVFTYSSTDLDSFRDREAFAILIDTKMKWFNSNGYALDKGTEKGGDRYILCDEVDEYVDRINDRIEYFDRFSDYRISFIPREEITTEPLFTNTCEGFPDINE